MSYPWKRIAFGFGFVVLAGLLVLVGIYPYRPNSVWGWLLLFGLALPVIFVFECVGERLLNPEFVARFGYLGRIVYGVLVLGIVLVTVMFAFQFLEPFFGKWGS